MAMFDNRQGSSEIVDHHIESMLGSERAICFGSFRLFPTQRLLFQGYKPLRLGSRALDILIALVERPAELVSKEELMARVWPNTFVDAANLRVQVAALRRILGDGRGGNRFLINIPGRGYRFVAPMTLAEESLLSCPRSVAVERMQSVPAHVTGLSGHEGALCELTSQVSRDRLLAVAGPDGNGKRSITSAVADELIANYKHGIWLIETFLCKAG
jgi:DNA-binding winged helix-turn-helix (wHTH) protein